MNNKAISAQDLTGDSVFHPDDTVLLELEYNLPIHAGPIADISNYKGKVLSTIEEIKKARGDFSEYQSLKSYTLLFRGLKNTDYQLLSSLGRKDNIDAAAEETRVINDYYNLGKEYGWEEFLPPDTDKTLFYMSIARHDGQVSRLLDWSVSFYAALSFLSNRPEVDSRLWVLCFKRDSLMIENQLNPLSIKDNRVHLFKLNYLLPYGKTLKDAPNGIQRMFNQNGWFTACSLEQTMKPLDDVVNYSDQDIHLMDIIISKEGKKAFLESDLYMSEDALLLR